MLVRILVFWDDKSVVGLRDTDVSKERSNLILKSFYEMCKNKNYFSRIS
jgi:hypothetical protein